MYGKIGPAILDMKIYKGCQFTFVISLLYIFAMKLKPNQAEASSH